VGGLLLEVWEIVVRWIVLREEQRERERERSGGRLCFCREEGSDGENQEVVWWAVVPF
jgi:hypothetical protein